MTEFVNIVTFFAIAIGTSAAFCCIGFAFRCVIVRRPLGVAEEGADPYELVLYFAAGGALTGFLCFVAAALHVFYWPVVILPLAIFCAFIAGRDSNAKWFVALMRSAVSGGGWLPFVVALIIAVPSVLPDITSDGQAFHLVYAKEWADAHALTIDPSVREPLYAMNWLTLDALFELLGLGWYAPVLSGLCYLWSVVGIFALARAFVPPTADRKQTQIAYVVCLAATLSFVISPTVMHWGLTGLVDGALGFYFLGAVMAGVRAFQRRSVTWTLTCALLAGFFIGMKTSLFLFAPLFLVLTISLGWRLPQRWKSAAASGLAFVVFGAPWYVRNVILDGDPIAPTLNLMFGTSDLFWSKNDLAGQVADLGSRSLGIVTIASLPFRIVFNTTDYAFREYGVSVAYLLIYLPLVLLAIDLVRMRRGQAAFFAPGALLVFACFSYAVAYFEFSSVLGRYTELFAPLLSACLGIVAIRCLKFERFWIATLAVVLLLAIPSPSSYSWLTYNEQFIIQGLSLDRETFLMQRLDGYKVAAYVSRTLRERGSRGSVYQVGAGNLCLVLRRGGNPCVGDWFGPSRFEDLGIAIHMGESGDYVRRFNLAAFIIRTGGQPISNLTVAMLEKQLAPFGFATVPGIDPNYILIMRGAKAS